MVLGVGLSFLATRTDIAGRPVARHPRTATAARSALHSGRRLGGARRPERRLSQHHRVHVRGLEDRARRREHDAWNHLDDRALSHPLRVPAGRGRLQQQRRSRRRGGARFRRRAAALAAHDHPAPAAAGSPRGPAARRDHERGRFHHSVDDRPEGQDLSALQPNLAKLQFLAGAAGCWRPRNPCCS